MESGANPGESVTVKLHGGGDKSDTWEEMLLLPEPEARIQGAHFVRPPLTCLSEARFLLLFRGGDLWYILSVPDPAHLI